MSLHFFYRNFYGLKTERLTWESLSLKQTEGGGGISISQNIAGYGIDLAVVFQRACVCGLCVHAVCMCVRAVYACVRTCCVYSSLGVHVCACVCAVMQCPALWQARACVCVWVSCRLLSTCALTNLSNLCDRPAII